MKECSQCGRCCQEETCQIGLEAFPEDADKTCPVLIWEEGKAFCGFVKCGEMIHESIPDMVSELLGIGVGCDSELILDKGEWYGCHIGTS